MQPQLNLARDPIGFLFLTIGFFLYAMCSGGTVWGQDPGLDGQPFRLVWAQDHGNQADVYGGASHSKLMKYDSTVGKEEVLLDELQSVGNPMLSSDGEWVVYSERMTNRIYKVPFAGGEPEELATGFAAELWRDPADGTDTVFVAGDPVGYMVLPAWGKIERLPLHGASGSPAPFWSARGMMANNFQLSADGKVGSGQFPWPIGGVAAIDTQSWFPLDRGCWPSLAPDNSYLFWQFAGDHRNLMMQDPVTRKQWMVNLSSAPGIEGREVYHPRWSNHPKYIAFTGPYKEGVGGNRIKFGGKGVEVYIGSFADDFSKMESMRKITSNENADFFPDLWVKGGGEVVSSLPQRDGFKTANDVDYSLYFGWETAKADNRGPKGEALKKLHLFDKSYLGPNHELVLRGNGGHANAFGDHKDWRHTVGRTQSWTMEAVYTSAVEKQNGRMFGYTQNSKHVNVFINQRTNRVAITMNVVGDPVTYDLGPIEKGEPLHVIVSVDNLQFRAWVNGRLVEKTLPGLTFWGQGSMIWGEQLGYGASWRGSISHIRMITRQLRSDEVAERTANVQAEVEAWSRPKQARVRAKLVELSSTSSPEAIAPYTNELSAGAYELVEVLDGAFDHKTFAAYGFGIINKKMNPDRPQTIGKMYTFDLEPFDEQPQLRSEVKSNDLEDVTLPTFLILP